MSQGEADSELVRRIAAGDRTALAHLVERHEGAVFQYARSLARDRPTAEDAMQQAFLDAMRGAHTWRGTGSVRGWLLTLTRHAVYRSARRRSGEPAAYEPLAELAVRAGWGDPEATMDRQWSLERLRRALESLEPEQMEVIVLRDLQELTGPETADILGVSLSAMKSRLHRARLALTAAVHAELPHGS